MEYEKTINLPKDSNKIVRREPVHLARNTILLTIAVTSGIWLVLDAFLFYSSGFMSLPQTFDDDFKMPTDRRNVNNKNKSVPLIFNLTIQDNVRKNALEDSDSIREINKPWHRSKLLSKLRNKKKTGDYDVQGFFRSFNESVGVINNRIETIRKELNQTAQAYKNQPVRYEKIINVDIRSSPGDVNGPGENGKAVTTSPREAQLVKQGWKQAEFNQYVSDKIPFERSVPDTRPDGCREQTFPYSLLPKTSIIICFTEESWSTLLRTVHSIINRSPPELVQEILLIDDFSQRDHLQEPLENYLKNIPKVRLLRTTKREGLIRARLIGVEAAKASVLTFLDSHIECNVGWLEPLLETIRLNRTTVVSPIIDSISARSFKYSGTPSEAVKGGFKWEALGFTWISLTSRDRQARKNKQENINTPTIAGGLFSIDKSFFYELGLYDPGLEIWGAENIELSFKVWMCGGKLVLSPCSHVGHIFRDKQPYSFPADDNVSTFLKNSQRVAEVWMDDYKEIFYVMLPQLRYNSVGDISDRLALRRKLQCKSFQWYLENVYPEQSIPDTNVKAEGALKNLGSGMCVDAQAHNSQPGIFTCHNQGGNQLLRLTKKNTLEIRENCLVRQGQNSLRVGFCSRDKSQQITWAHTKGGFLEDTRSGKCLTAVPPSLLLLEKCSETNDYQKWQFDQYRTL